MTISVRKEKDAEQGRREDVSINGELNINGAARNFAAQRDLPKRRTNATAKRESVESLEENLTQAKLSSATPTLT